MPRPRSINPRSNIANVRLTNEEHADMEHFASSLGFKSISEYLRSLHRAARQQLSQDNAEQPESETLSDKYPEQLIRPFHKTGLGEILWGDSRAWLLSVAKPGSVDLI